MVDRYIFGIPVSGVPLASRIACTHNNRNSNYAVPAVLMGIKPLSSPKPKRRGWTGQGRRAAPNYRLDLRGERSFHVPQWKLIGATPNTNIKPISSSLYDRVCHLKLQVHKRGQQFLSHKWSRFYRKQLVQRSGSRWKSTFGIMECKCVVYSFLLLKFFWLYQVVTSLRVVLNLVWLLKDWLLTWHYYLLFIGTKWLWIPQETKTIAIEMKQ